MIYYIAITNIEGTTSSTTAIDLDIGIDVATNTAILKMPLNQSILPPILNIVSDSGVVLNKKAIKTINNINSFLDGAFNILGSLCVSLHLNLLLLQPTDQLNTALATGEQVNLDIHYDLSELELNKKSSVLVYDGCTACLNCNTLWKLHEALLEAHLWAVAMKDCILYNLDTAKLLWNNTLSLEGFSNTLLGWTSTTLSPLCFYNYNITNSNYRETLFIKAMRLLHLYKATVAIWNYLCFLNTSQIQIVEASLDWAGFVIQAKKTYNNCDAKEKTENNTPVTLYLDLQLTEGQIAAYLQSPIVLLKKARHMLLFASVVDLNTYIEIGTDSGGHSTRTYSYLRQRPGNNNEQDATKGTILYSYEFIPDKFLPVFCSQSQSDDNQGTDTALDSSTQLGPNPDPPIRFKFLFKNLPPLRLILSASIKILPVVVYYDPNNYRIFENILTYTAHRLKANAIAAVEQTRKNRWAITTGWKLKTQVDCIRLETRYYTTGFCKYPSTILLDFE